VSLDLDAIKARLAAACPGPWKPGKLRRSVDGDCLMLVREDNPYVIAATIIPQYGDNDTATMLLHSRADMDALVAEVDRLRALVVSIVENVVEARTEDENRRLQLLDDAGGLENEIRRLREENDLLRGERPAVVEYLRTRPGYGPVADAIENGDHRLEGEER